MVDVLQIGLTGHDIAFSMSFVLLKHKGGKQENRGYEKS